MNKIDLRHVDLNLLVVFEVLMAEGSVTRAAERLGRTQSAVSHALARLRGQLGDPLLVRAAGAMRPSPFAVELIEEVRPILLSVQRVLSPRRAFDPVSSRRVFRVALPDLGLTLFPRLLELVREHAPGVALQWLGYREAALIDLLEGRLDAALGPAALRLPDGIATQQLGALRWASFGRRGHPAFAHWGRKAWSRWPHVVVGLDDRVRNPVDAAASALRLERVVGARVPSFAAVAPLLARSDLLATLPAVVMLDAQRRFGIETMPVPFHIEPMPHMLMWSARLSNDAEIGWLLRHLHKAVAETFSASESLVRAAR